MTCDWTRVGLKSTLTAPSLRYDSLPVRLALRHASRVCVAGVVMTDVTRPVHRTEIRRIVVARVFVPVVHYTNAPSYLVDELIALITSPRTFAIRFSEDTPNETVVLSSDHHIVFPSDADS